MFENSLMECKAYKIYLYDRKRYRINAKNLDALSSLARASIFASSSLVFLFVLFTYKKKGQRFLRSLGLDLSNPEVCRAVTVACSQVIDNWQTLEHRAQSISGFT